MNSTARLKNLNVEVISSNHTLMINDSQIDLWYMFDSGSLQMFVDGRLIISSRFHPSRLMLNYNNIIEVAVRVYEFDKKYNEKTKDDE
jgi:ribosomal protein L31